MGTSEVHLPEGENLIGLCCSDELHFFFSFFLLFYYVYSLALDVHRVPSLPRLIGSAETRGKSLLYCFPSYHYFLFLVASMTQRLARGLTKGLDSSLEPV